MPKLLTPFIFILGWMFSLHQAKGQDLQLIGSGGNMTSAGNIYLSQSFGEPLVQYVQNGNQWLTQGYQQPEHINLMVGTHETDHVSPIYLFPNPAISEITINGIEQTEFAKIHLTNLLGQLVPAPVNVYSDHVIIDVHQLPAGMYAIHIQSKTSSPFSTFIFKN